MATAKKSRPNAAVIRRARIAVIKIACKRLGLLEPREGYEQMLQEATGTDLTSCATMSIEQLDQVVKHLKTKGYDPNADDSPQASKIRAQWADMNRLGLLRDGSFRAMRAFIKRQTGISHERFLTAKQANQVIEALKTWKQRELKKRLEEDE